MVHRVYNNGMLLAIRQKIAALAEHSKLLRQRSAARGQPKRHGGAAFIVLIVILAGAYFVPRGISWNADTHVFLTASIVDRGTLNIDPFARYTGDLAFSHGHYYADKAPGLSLLAVPVYALIKYTLLGGKPYTALFAVPPAQRTDFFVRYLLAVVYAAVPTGALAALLFHFLARLGISTKWRAFVALTYGLGTIARAFAGQFFSHQLAAALVFGGFVLVFRVRHVELSRRYAALAGLLLGYAIITEYPTALIAAAVGIYALTAPKQGLRIGVLLALGALPALALGALYNTLAFGGPLSQGYTHLAGPMVYRIGQSQGFMGITYPHLDAIWQTTFGPYRGIFLLSPVLLLAAPGFMMLWRRVAWRAETALWLGIVCSYWLFTVSYFAWDGGFSMGPRQFLPALPFLVLPIGEVLRAQHSHRWRIAAIVLGAYSMLVVGIATAVGPLTDPRYASPLTEWVLPRLAGLIPDPTHPVLSASLLAALLHHTPFFLTARLDNNWGMLFGLPGLLQLLPLVLLITFILLWHWYKTGKGATLKEAGLARVSSR